jgi:sigma-B regulation protein RsbU (phosphoserine phosphatase)
LLCVYLLLGFLPVLLLLSMSLLTGWALMSELAIYLASSALDRRIDAVQSSVQFLQRVPLNEREQRDQEMQRGFSSMFPGIEFYVHDATGEHKFPPTSPDLRISPKWGDVSGLLVLRKHFYAWAHYHDDKEEITVLAPLSRTAIENLVPHLGVIGLVEEPGDNAGDALPEAAAQDAEFSLGESRESKGEVSGSKIPPPVNRFDITVLLPAVQNHFHLDTPGKIHHSVLYVRSRISAVLRAFFSDQDVFRGIVADALVGIGILFLLVEIVAVVIGVSLSRRIMRAVNQMYEGTRRVIRGDFTHRIPVKTRDQLGDLALSFNQMTSHLERLVLVEKERERLQAELEIAREVQKQLYPREEPPSCGLKLTARCDPARMVSGDYYDYQAVGKAQLAFAIGDVAGKGISAALLMATIQAALRAQVSQSLPTIESECSHLPELNSAVVVSKLNKQVYAHTSPEKYATFFFALYDELTRTVTYTNAGHLSPLLFRDKEVVPLDSNGTVVGAFPFAKYDASCVEIEPGDLLVCYTDGITEPENAYGEMFGEERLIELVRRHVQAEEGEIIRLVFEAVRNWTGSPELQDDMTLLLARQVGAAA